MPIANLGSQTLKFKTMLRHIVALGSSGSGKSVACKVIIEEAARQGVPAIVCDPQGDLASLIHPSTPEDLIEHGVDPKLLDDYVNNVEVVIWTPTSDAGIPLCVNPLAEDTSHLESTDRIKRYSALADMVAGLIDMGANEFVCAALNLTLEYWGEHGDTIDDLAELSLRLENMPEELAAKVDRVIKPTHLANVARRIACAQTGSARLMFNYGTAMDIDVLLGKGSSKTRISIIYLNTLSSMDDKIYYLAALADCLYSWMLRNPSPELQALFYIDEVASFLPPTSKPVCKPPLTLIFKQARKYGIGCLIASQNIADVDYRCLAQFSTWMLGRILTKQDRDKIRPTLQGLAGAETDNILDKLPRLQAGNFILVSPNELSCPVELKTRWLLTKHTTLTEDGVSRATSDRLREQFQSQSSSSQGQQVSEKQPSPSLPSSISQLHSAQAPSARNALPQRSDLERRLGQLVLDQARNHLIQRSDLFDIYRSLRHGRAESVLRTRTDGWLYRKAKSLGAPYDKEVEDLFIKWAYERLEHPTSCASS